MGHVQTIITKTNNVGSGQLRYTIWHFAPHPPPLLPPPLQAELKCHTHTRSRQSVNSNIRHSKGLVKKYRGGGGGVGRSREGVGHEVLRGGSYNFQLPLGGG